MLQLWTLQKLSVDRCALTQNINTLMALAMELPLTGFTACKPDGSFQLQPGFHFFDTIRVL
jgi:hypothetical protein